MSKLLIKPSHESLIDLPAKFQKFNLIENPFPSEPVVNKDSEDKRMNGNIFEVEIRRKEYEQIENNFLKVPQSNLTHSRLGYIIDKSYIGRGNGKSALLIYLQQNINKEYCLDISNGKNKCFAIYLTPEPGGRTKTFSRFVDLFFQAILYSNIIRDCLAILRLQAIRELYPDFNLDSESENEDLFIENLNSKNWFDKNKLDILKISDLIFKNKYLQDIPSHFPLFIGRNTILRSFVSQNDFENYYLNDLKKGKERPDFIFSFLVRFFQAASFNGAYILVDDFERIPDFQSARQKRDFAFELRSCLFDGFYINSRIGFYNFLLVLHAGVEGIIKNAWEESGMENRAPISQQMTSSKHIIPFEKLNREHVSLLLKKYLSEYRIDSLHTDPLFPFTETAISKIGELSEYNAAKILKMAYVLLDKASEITEQEKIDEKFVIDNRGEQLDTIDKSITTIKTAETEDLMKKAKNME